jgi:DNA-binding CsgD family transcriptional regulator
MALHQDELLNLIDAIYGAGMDAGRWPAVLQQVADAFCAGEASLSAVSSNAVPWLVAPRTDPNYLQSYAAHYHPLNLFWQRMTQLPVGTAVTNAMVMPVETLRTSEFYNDWSRPQGYLAVMGATLLVEDGWRVEFVMPGKKDFGREHLKLYRAIAPHLTRAMQMQQRLARAEMVQAEATGALDDLTQGVIMVDAQARVLFANQAAGPLFTDSLKLQDGTLRTCSSLQTTELLAVIAACGRAGHADAGGYVSVSRGPNRLPLSLLVIPVRSPMAGLVMRRPAAMIFCSDPERVSEPEGLHLQQQFGLTPAEAAVARELLRGDGVQAAAARLGVAVATARTHLRRVLAKTGTSRQAELVRLILGARHLARRD